MICIPPDKRRIPVLVYFLNGPFMAERIKASIPQEIIGKESYRFEYQGYWYNCGPSSNGGYFEAALEHPGAYYDCQASDEA